MNENQKIEYWIDISGYDLDTASAMHQTKRFLYVGFMCHQAIEKILKAYYVYSQNQTPPYTHNLTVLAEKGEIYDFFSEDQKNLIDFLEPLNIKARYPSHKEQIYKMIDEEKSGEILNKTRDLQLWIKKKLSKS